MNAIPLINSLERFGTLLPMAVGEIPLVDARWKPPDGAWSILEIVRHLLDEEIEDFRTRVRMTIENPDEPWPPIDPPGWAVQRRYNEADLNSTVEEFVRERAFSVNCLRGMHNPNWESTHLHPKLPPLRAGDLLTSWAAHDALHLRQIAKRMHQLAQRDGGEFSARYAGEWTA